MNKIQIQMKRAKKKGMSPLEVCRMKEIARHQAESMIGQAREEAFLMALYIPLNVLLEDYWKKSGDKRAPRFIDDCLSLYSAIGDGTVTMDEVIEYVERYAKCKIKKGGYSDV